MKKNIFDRMSDSYERFHLKESEIRMGNDSISVSPKLKLVLGWSVFLLCAVLAYVFVGFPFLNVGGATKVDKKDVLSQKVDTKNEHDTIVPYEKDADKELNAFIGDYFKAITSCDNEKLQDMVTDSSEYSNNESLKKKAEFITGYDNITVYTKEGLEEGSYVAFVVSNLTIAGVNSSPYDISTLYIVTGSQGFRIQNGTLPDEISKYIEKVKGDKDIQKIYKSVEKKNEGTKDTVFLTGRLDTATAPELDTFAEKELINTQELVLDFAGLEYISSAGLRVILKMQKFMNVKGTMKLIHVSDIIQDVFDITGFADILSIE